MYQIVIVLTVLVAILLIGVVLIQKSKGGGLSSQFGGANAVLGVRSANKTVENATWTLVALLVVLSVISTFMMPRSNGAELRTQPAAATAPVATQPAGQFDTPAATTTPAVDVVETSAVDVVETPAPAETEQAD